MHEACGIFGIYSTKEIDTFSIAQFGMFALQHRGQEACGVSVLKGGQIRTAKKEGLVLDMFKSISDTGDFMGNAAIGHTRYSTSGDSGTKNFQPFYATNAYGKVHMSFVHNGNLVDFKNVRQELIDEDFPFLGDSDSEVLLRLVQKYFDRGLVEAVKEAVKHVKGSFSVLILTKDGMVAFRDAQGVRPLCIGKLDNETYVCCSEDAALNAIGAKFVRNVEPDTTLENIDVYKIRTESGKRLYEQSPVEADVVIGVPDSGIPSAVGYSQISGIPYEPILVKNRYMSRSFIIPTQAMRERVVNLKLNPIANQ
ncbi:unnamed protein product, partial [Cyprideis torosa]